MCGHTTITITPPARNPIEFPYLFTRCPSHEPGGRGGAGAVYLVFVIVSLSQPTVARGAGRGGRYGGGMSLSGSAVVTMDSGYDHPIQPAHTWRAARLRM